MYERIKKLSLLAVSLTIFGCDAGMDSIKRQVANDAVDQYNLSVKGGDLIEICVYAGLVVAAYNQAQDQANYLKWKTVEKADCKKAGMP